jgi:NADPH-dependent glutamate synthase beta subunit-like oxidoreductase/NAD-dependent dihydropyrimidine dehydrogenase PreA subunit
MWQSLSISGAHVEDAIRQLLPPCQIKCPINEDIQRTNVLISLLPRDINSAKQGIIQIGDYLYEKNPFFNICGYICGLCELECNYKAKGGSIRRRLLKRFLSDYYTDYLNLKKVNDIKKDKEDVAIIGGGPGGLMCAYVLSKKGYKVTIFEATDRLGGALWLIPNFRLPKDVLQITLNNLIRIGRIDVKYRSNFGDDKFTIEKLKGEGYKAIFLAKGTPSPMVLTFNGTVVEGQDLAGTMYGHTLLYEVSHGNITQNYFKNKKVIVIGGGNIAMDVARTARRLSGEVTVVAMESENKMSRDGISADEEVVKGAWEEGIKIVYSRGVSKIIGGSGKFEGIECPKCVRLFTEKGLYPVFDVSDIMTLLGDILIITIGQGPDKVLLQREGFLDERGSIAVDPFTLQSLKKDMVFIGGDVRRLGFMVEAMREGMEAAESIHRYLRALPMREGRKRDFEKFPIPLRDSYKPATDVVWIPPEKRRHFQLFERGLTLKEAIEEAKRCVTCGPCVSCKACISIGFEKSLYAVEVDVEKCSGCGTCVYACNFNSAHLIEREGIIVSETDMFRCKSCGICVVACPSGARKLVDDTTDQRITEVYASLS